MTAADRILLHALLGDGSLAASAASPWLDVMALDRLNEGRRRLLPLLRHRMHEWQLVHPAKPAIDRVHRDFWLRDQRLQFQAGVVLRALAPLDAPVVVLKGLLLGRRYYPAGSSCIPARTSELMEARGIGIDPPVTRPSHGTLCTRSSAVPSSPLRSSTVCCTTVTSSPSAARAIGSKRSDGPDS